MSIWTIDDQRMVQNAIRDLAMGKRIVKFKIDTGNGLREHEYAQADLPQLQKLLAMINQDIANAKRTRFFGVTSG